MPSKRWSNRITKSEREYASSSLWRSSRAEKRRSKTKGGEWKIRGEIFGRGGALAGGALLGGASANAESRRVSARPQAGKIKVIVCGGHPGDPEYGCGGTVARLTQMGHDVVLFYLNDGGWPPTSSAARVAEAKKACEL